MDGCVNTDGAFHCVCPELSYLEANGTTCRGWGSPTTLETDDTGDASQVELVHGDSGDALLAWVQNGQPVHAKRFQSDSGWSPTQILVSTKSRSTRAFSATLAGSHTWLLYTDDTMVGTNINHGLWVRSFSAGAGWSEPKPLATESVLQEIAIRANAQGDVIAAWMEGSSGSVSLWTSRKTAAQDWSTAKHIEVRSDRRALAIALLPSGAAYAATTIADRMSVSMFSPSTGWGAFTALDPPGGRKESNSPRFSMSTTQTTLAWLQAQATGESFKVSQFVPATGWSTPDEISFGAGGLVCDISADAQNNRIALWVDRSDSDGSGAVWARYFDHKLGWTMPSMISHPTMARCSGLKAAMDSAGNGLALWLENDTVWTNRFVPALGWGSPTQLAAETAAKNGLVLALSPEGSGFAAWIDQDGARRRLRISRFE